MQEDAILHSHSRENLKSYDVHEIGICWLHDLEEVLICL
jgi:hypothetical protein